MKRRDFLVKTGCAFAGLVATLAILKQGTVEGMQFREENTKYKIDIEIHESKGFCWFGRHKKGDKFNLNWA